MVVDLQDPHCGEVGSKLLSNFGTNPTASPTAYIRDAEHYFGLLARCYYGTIRFSEKVPYGIF